MIKRNELSSHKYTWTNLQSIVLSQRSQPGKFRTSRPWKGKTMETVKGPVVASGFAGGRVRQIGGAQGIFLRQ